MKADAATKPAAMKAMKAVAAMKAMKPMKAMAVMKASKPTKAMKANAAMKASKRMKAMMAAMIEPEWLHINTRNITEVLVEGWVDDDGKLKMKEFTRSNKND